MKSISTRMLGAFFLIIGLNILLTALALFIGYRSSADKWNAKVREEAQVVLEQIFDHIMDQGGFTEGGNCLRDLAGRGERFAGIAQIDVFDTRGELIESWTNDSLEHYAPRPAERDTALPYYYDNDLIGFVAMYPAGFSHMEHNRLFIVRLIAFAALGLGISLLLSLALAFRTASHFKKEARNTARSLMNLARGSGEVQIVPAVTAEIATINEAALSLQEKLRREEGLKNKWYESIAHDLRTPIAAMKSQFIACRDGILPITPERWQTILDELAGMEGMIKDFSYLSKIESSDLKIDRQTIESREIMEYLTAGLSSFAWEKGITLVWDYRPFTLYCDFSLLTTACSQLIRNAIQHSSEGTEIQISLEREKETGLFRVVNEGRLSEEQIERIFDPLYKADISRGRHGSGMGLTISHRICRVLGASLAVRNLPDQRICFDISLPCPARA